MTSFLELFRQGYDTAQIAAMTGETEALVYNMMHRDKLGELEQAKHEKKTKRYQKKWRSYNRRECA